MDNKEMQAIEQERKKLLSQLKGEYIDPLQNQLDQIDIKIQKGYTSSSTISLDRQVMQVVKSATWINDFKQTKRGGALDFSGIDLMSKASDVSRTADAIPYQWTPFQYGPQRRHIRDFLPVSTASGPQIWMPYESAVTDATARVAEAGAKPQSDWTTAVEKYPIEKIATFLVFTTELLEDHEQLVSYVTTQWIEKLKRVEDTQLLYGTGSNQLYGLTVKASAYVDALATASIDRWAVVDNATTQVQTAGFMPNYCLVHPTTAMHIRQSRATTYEYIMNPSAPMVVNGCTIVPHPAMAVGDFLVGDFISGAQIWDKRSANVQFFDQDSTNVRYNKITAVIEERLALVTYQPTAFVFGNFTVALAQGSA